MAKSYELVVNGVARLSGSEAQCNERAALWSGRGVVEVRPRVIVRRQREQASLCECERHYDDGTGCCRD